MCHRQLFYENLILLLFLLSFGRFIVTIIFHDSNFFFEKTNLHLLYNLSSEIPHQESTTEGKKNLMESS